MIRRTIDALLGRDTGSDVPLTPYLREMARPPQPREEAPPERRAARRAPPAAPPAETRPRLASLLGSRSALRQAILMQEVLGPPKGLRPNRRPAPTED